LENENENCSNGQNNSHMTLLLFVFVGTRGNDKRKVLWWLVSVYLFELQNGCILSTCC